jgi:hypothetical protein
LGLFRRDKGVILEDIRGKCIWQIKSNPRGSRKLGHPELVAELACSVGLPSRRLPKKMMQQAAGCIIFSGLPETANRI